MSGKVKTMLSTVFTTPPKSHKHGETETNGSAGPRSRSTPVSKGAMPPAAAGPDALDDILPSNQAVASTTPTSVPQTTASHAASLNLPSRPQPTHPPPVTKSSTPLPSKIRHNSYPTSHTTSSASVRLKSKTSSSRPALLASRLHRLDRERRAATTESKVCHADLLRQGIKIRDFQREKDEREVYLRSEALLRRKLEEVVASAGVEDGGKTSSDRGNSDSVHRNGMAADGSGDAASVRSECPAEGLSDAEDLNGSGDKVVFQGKRKSGVDSASKAGYCGRRLKKPMSK